MIYTVLDGKKGWFILSLECVYHEGEFDLNVFGLMKVGPYKWRSLSGAPHFVVYPDSTYCGSFLLCVMRRWLPPFPNKLPFSQAFQEISEVCIEHNSASFRYLELRLIFSLTSSLNFFAFSLVNCDCEVWDTWSGCWTCLFLNINLVRKKACKSRVSSGESEAKGSWGKQQHLLYRIQMPLFINFCS